MAIYQAQPLTIVLIDDDEPHLELLEQFLRQRMADEIEIQKFHDPADAIAGVSTEGQAVIICDHNMPGSTGLDWMPDLVRAGIGPVILLTGAGDERLASAAFGAGASDYLVKSSVFSNPEVLVRAISQASRRDRLEQRNRQLSTKLRLANRELESQNNRLRFLNRTAEAFVDNVAHEFRTPLAVVKEFAAIIRDGIGGPVTECQMEYLRFIDNATRDLAQMVDDFLDSGKLRAGTLRVERTVHTVEELLDSVEVILACRAETKNITVVREIAPGTRHVTADIEKAGRVLINLVVNAIKFSPPESTVRIEAGPGENGGVRIAVRDEGPGLAPEELESIFERFRQVGDIHGSSDKGFGLGLNIARELVWLNLGNIEVQSTPNEGSEFAFTLPSDDPQDVIRCFADRLDEIGRFSDLAVLDVRTADPMRTRALLAGACYPRDLILPSQDGLRLIGSTGDPEAWISRVNQAGRAESGGDESFEVACAARWPEPEVEGLVDFVTGDGQGALNVAA